MWHPYPHKLAIASPTSGGRSVGIVRSRTQTMEFSFSFFALAYQRSGWVHCFQFHWGIPKSWTEYKCIDFVKKSNCFQKQFSRHNTSTLVTYRELYTKRTTEPKLHANLNILEQQLRLHTFINFHINSIGFWSCQSTRFRQKPLELEVRHHTRAVLRFIVVPLPPGKTPFAVK
jgi:hypothetical protein